MISVTELKNGTYFLLEGKPCLVLKYEHSKIGRGSANIKLRLRNLVTGAVIDKTFISGAKVEPVVVLRQKMQYLYADEAVFYFMDSSSFEQISISKETAGDQAKFLKEGEEVHVSFWGKKPLSIELPASLIFRIKEAEPGVKGDSATNVWKEAVLENGLKIKVPLFIKQGEMVKVDTRTGEYLERAKLEKD